MRFGRVSMGRRRYGRRIARAAADHDPGFKWEFKVIKSDQANAFALPGGKPPTFMSTHPSAETRIRQFKEWMPEALEIRKKHCGDQ